MYAAEKENAPKGLGVNPNLFKVRCVTSNFILDFSRSICYNVDTKKKGDFQNETRKRKCNPRPHYSCP